MLPTFLNRKRPIAVLVGAMALLASGCMWGVIRDAETGGALPGATVSYTDSYGHTGSTTTDANGIYVFDQSRGPVPAMGPVTIQVNAAGYGPSAESRQVAYDDGPQPALSNLSSFWEVQSFGLTASPAWSYAGQPTLGAVNARVRIVEFADFQCPYCVRAAFDVLPRIVADFGDRVLIVFRNFPLTEMHPNAYPAAEAAECAYQQGAFWQYHDRLFANQGALDVASLKGYAAAIGLDTAAFDECLDSGRTAPAVDADIAALRAAAAEAGITQYGVPAFFINGQPAIGAYPYDESAPYYQPGMLTFKKMIEEALAEAPQ
jgi:predicted DsbA family dithiol-disulfide isomerase